MGPARVTQPPFKLAELPQVDAVVLSHNHCKRLLLACILLANKIQTTTPTLRLSNTSTLRKIKAPSTSSRRWAMRSGSSRSGSLPSMLLRWTGAFYSLPGFRAFTDLSSQVGGARSVGHTGFWI